MALNLNEAERQLEANVNPKKILADMRAAGEI